MNDKRLKALEELSRLDQELGLDESRLPTDCVVDGYRLVCTCPACPEQYDVFDADGKQVGYLRLRHGYFRADFPSHRGETIYESHPKGDGIFDDAERPIELKKAIAAIHAKVTNGS